MVWYYDIHTLVCTKCIFPIRCINNIFAPLLQISPRFGNRDQGPHSGHSDSSPLSAKVQTCLQFDRQSTPAFSSLVGSRLIVRTHAIYLSIYLSRGALCSPFLQSKKKDVPRRGSDSRNRPLSGYEVQPAGNRNYCRDRVIWYDTVRYQYYYRVI